ncbi:MAG: hypothetical protein HUJ61_04895, partial [Bacilli bacterium]|nr:hypothetical protein [Bacilli bacterium]
MKTKRFLIMLGFMTSVCSLGINSSAKDNSKNSYVPHVSKDITPLYEDGGGEVVDLNDFYVKNYDVGKHFCDIPKGSYKLTSNLILDDSSISFVTNSEKTELDLNGYYIVAQGSGRVYIKTGTDVVIKDSNPTAEHVIQQVYLNDTYYTTLPEENYNDIIDEEFVAVATAEGYEIKTKNAITIQGGGFVNFCKYKDSSAALDESDLKDDTNSDFKGGLFHIVDAKVTVERGNILYSHVSGFGGAVYVGKKGKFYYEGGTIYGCSSQRGGAVYVGEGGYFNCKSKIDNCVAIPYKNVDEWQAGGGAIYVDLKGEIYLGACEITNCTAFGNGGAIYLNKGNYTNYAFLDGMNFKIKNCSALNNSFNETFQNEFIISSSSGKGGAIYCGPWSCMTITGTEITNNYNVSGFGAVTLEPNTTTVFHGTIKIVDNFYIEDYGMRDNLIMVEGLHDVFWHSFDYSANFEDKFACKAKNNMYINGSEQPNIKYDINGGSSIGVMTCNEDSPIIGKDDSSVNVITINSLHCDDDRYFVVGNSGNNTYVLNEKKIDASLVATAADDPLELNVVESEFDITKVEDWISLEPLKEKGVYNNLKVNIAVASKENDSVNSSITSKIDDALIYGQIIYKYYDLGLN